jgi:hypothetical protein
MEIWICVRFQNEFRNGLSKKFQNQLAKYSGKIVENFRSHRTLRATRVNHRGPKKMKNQKQRQLKKYETASLKNNKGAPG